MRFKFTVILFTVRTRRRLELRSNRPIGIQGSRESFLGIQEFRMIGPVFSRKPSYDYIVSI